MFAPRLDITKQIEFFYSKLPKTKPQLVDEREVKTIQTNNGYWIYGEITGQQNNMLILECENDKIFFSKNKLNFKKGDFVKFFAPYIYK